jgi:carbonic anhydrase
MKAKLSPNLISFVAIRRGDWIMKISVYKNREVLVIAQHYFELDNFHIKHFHEHNEAADYIEFLAKDLT